MADRRTYIFTNHLRERFVQRTNKKYQHLQDCKKKDCDLCRSLVMEIHETLQVRRPIDGKIAERLDTAVECRAYLNDSRFMKWYYEKYGFDRRFEFLVSGDLVFVVVVEKGRKIVVTCITAKTHIAALPALRPKFNKIKKAEEKLADKILDELPLSGI